MLALVALWLLWPTLRWALWEAVYIPDEAACRAALGQGACWGVVVEKLRPIVFGRYPQAELWRPMLAIGVLAALVLASSQPRCWRWFLWPLWLVGLGLFVVLMGGGWGSGWFGLAPVPTLAWGGLPLTLLLTVLAMSLALPFAVLLALARQSAWAVPRVLATTYIEFVRGVPLVTVLFMASFLVPLLLPPGWQLDLLVRVALALVMFGAAYLAEVVRGGLQSVPTGQIEAARAMGFGAWQVQRWVVLPQALRAALPAMMNSFIGMLKDTSLVTVVGLYELTGALSLALGGDARWRTFYLEGYLFIAAVYWVLCYGLSSYSRRLEAR
ncbi:MAG: amino acid ABC transporter permease [Burkholderiales bacterium]